MTTQSRKGTFLFKPGDIVEIQDSGSSDDCCAGKRGRVIRPFRPSEKSPVDFRDCWFVQTDHFCSIPRPESDLSLVPADTLAREWFDELGWCIYQDYEQSLAEGSLTTGEIKAAAAGGNPNCRHFLALYEAGLAESGWLGSK